MRFEHLVQINDPLNPLIDPLTRDQLWRGLMRYIETPVAFVEGLDSGRVTSRDGNVLHRELHFGRRVVRQLWKRGQRLVRMLIRRCIHIVVVV